MEMDSKMLHTTIFEVKHTKKSKQMAIKNQRKLMSGMFGHDQRSLFKKSLILTLPREILVLILSYLPARDLLRARQISVEFQKIICETRLLWVKVGLSGLQPTVHADVSMFFEKLASYGNAEASIKLAIHNLYFFNLKDVVKTKSGALNCAKCSCKNFLDAETLLPHSFYPFTWIFTRPPWVLKSGGLSNKELIFRLLLELLVRISSLPPNKTYKNLWESLMMDVLNTSKLEYTSREIEQLSACVTSKLAFNIAKLLMLCDTEEIRKYGLKVMELSSSLGNINATYEVLCMTEDSHKSDMGCKLHWHRRLRNCALAGNDFAKVHLCLEYAAGRVEDVSEESACAYVQQVLQSCKPSNIHCLKSYQKELEDLMRVILIDWLIEITDTKDMPPETIFMAVDILDRYLLSRPVKRVNLQLVGTTALLISTRFCCERNQLLTIRESSWLTDSTYGYREVVYMMGEYTGALKGQFIQPNVYSYAKIVSSLAKFGAKDDMMLRYVLESSLKFTDFGRYKPSLIASAAAMVVNLVQGYDAWPLRMEKWTGFEAIHLANCAMLLSSKCLSKLPLWDDREQLVEAADQKYSRDKYLNVAKFDFPSCEEFKTRILSLDDRLVPVQQSADYCQFEVSFIETTSSFDLDASVDYEADCEDVGEADSSFDELALFHPTRNKNEDRDCSDDDLNEEVEDIMDTSYQRSFVDREGATPSFYSDNENKRRLLPHRVHHLAAVRPPFCPAIERLGLGKIAVKRKRRINRRKLSRKCKRKHSSSDDETVKAALDTPSCFVGYRTGARSRGTKRPSSSQSLVPVIESKKRRAMF